jgi:hypothetical protein
MSEFIGVFEFAHRCGVSGTAVRKAIRTGRMNAVREDPCTGRTLLAWPGAAEEWQANTDLLRRTHTGPRDRGKPDGPGQSVIRLSTASVRAGDGTAAALSYADARTRREAYEARLAKLEYEEKSGLLVPIDQVRAKAFKLGQEIRDALLNIPDRIADEAAAERLPERVHAILMRELQSVIVSLESR